MIWLGIAIGAALLILAIGVLARRRAAEDGDAAELDPLFTTGIAVTGTGVALATTLGSVMYAVMAVGLVVVAAVEGSTRLWEQHPAGMRVALEWHDEIVRSTIERQGGYVFSTAGDAFSAAWRCSTMRGNSPKRPAPHRWPQSRSHTASDTTLWLATDEADLMLEQLRDQLDGKGMDYAGSLHDMFLLAARIVTEPETSCEVSQELLRTFAVVAPNLGPGFGANICACVAAGATGEVGATLRLVTRAKEASQGTNNDDGLPDLLLAPAAVGWEYGNATREARLTNARAVGDPAGQPSQAGHYISSEERKSSTISASAAG